MLQDKKIFDDLAHLANGAMGTLSSAKSEVEQVFKQRLERAISELDVVTREEFEIVKEMAVEARKENEALREELNALKSGNTTES